MKRSLFDEIPTDLPAELITVFAESENVKIERIVSEGHASPEDFWYDQEENEWVMLVSGSAVLSIDCNGVEPDVCSHFNHVKRRMGKSEHRGLSTCLVRNKN